MSDRQEGSNYGLPMSGEDIKPLSSTTDSANRSAPGLSLEVPRGGVQHGGGGSSGSSEKKSSMAAGTPMTAKQKEAGVSSKGAQALVGQLYSKLESSPPRWAVTELPTLPDFHPLEQTAVYIPNSTPKEIAARIDECLKVRSIATTFDNEKAKARCITRDNVDFRIFMYRGRNKYQHGVIVEVQRRRNFSFRFHSDVSAVLDAARAKHHPPTPDPVIAIISEAEEEQAAEESAHDPAVGEKRKYEPPSSLQIARDMLKNPTLDSTQMALESLSSLTDPERMGKRTAERVANQIVSGSEVVGGRDVRNAVISILQTNRLGPNDELPPSDEEYVETVRTLAMSVLSNSIAVLAESETFRSAFEGQEDMMLTEIVPLLLDQIKIAEQSPRMAALSAKCLRGIVLVLGADAIGPVMEGYALEHLESAQKVGQTQHAELAEMSAKCLEEIQKVFQ